MEIPVCPLLCPFIWGLPDLRCVGGGGVVTLNNSVSSGLGSYLLNRINGNELNNGSGSEFGSKIDNLETILR